jgi:aminoacylase
LVVTGVKVSCPGNPGHGSRFIEGTAAEKLRTVINRFLDFRQQEKNRLEANPELTLGDVTSINLTKIEVFIGLRKLYLSFL